jgi:hypothetical protein
MASSKWKSWDEIEEISSQRKLCAWGAANWVNQTLQHCDINFECVLDNNPNNLGIKFDGLAVENPSSFLERNRDVFVIITTNSYLSVIDELLSLGFVMGDDFCVSPLLNFRKDKDKLNKFDKPILFSSPEHAFTETTGGGLYRLSSNSGEIKKLVSGKGRGIVKYPDGYLWIDMLKGICILDDNFKIIDIISLLPNSEAHGLCYYAAKNSVIVAQPGRDSIGIYCLESGNCNKEIYVSKKAYGNKQDNHHINDLCVFGDSLFVSMFSVSGNWTNECYDGGVVEIDLTRSEENFEFTTVIQNLWMPHSISRFRGSLLTIDSMRGQLLDLNWRVVGEFSGFVRGLDFWDGNFILGISEHRYPEKLPRSVLNIPINAAIVIFDPQTKLSKSVNIKNTNSIHSVLIEKDR